MKAILMSIKPKWCEKIFSGEKTVDVRKLAPKLETPYKVYMYCTKRGRPLVWWTPCAPYADVRLAQTLGYSFGEAGEVSEAFNGKVVGEFVCDEKHDIQFTGASYTINNDRSLTNGIARQSCLQFDDMFSYLGVKGGAALHIANPKRYDTPKELSEFSRYGYQRIERVESGCGNEQCKYCEPAETIAGLYKPSVCRKGNCIVTRPPQSWMYVEEMPETSVMQNDGQR